MQCFVKKEKKILTTGPEKRVNPKLSLSVGTFNDDFGFSLLCINKKTRYLTPSFCFYYPNQ